MFIISTESDAIDLRGMACKNYEKENQGVNKMALAQEDIEQTRIDKKINRSNT